MSKEFYDFIRADTQGVMSGPATYEERTQQRLVGKVLNELFGGFSDA